jgi:citrate synthase
MTHNAMPPAAIVPPPQVIGSVKLEYEGRCVELPMVEGSEGERALDIRRLRAETGWITLDDAYTNTGSCTSAITFIDGERGILQYRGYPIEQIATQMTFPETALLLLQGEAPSLRQREEFSSLLTQHAMLHEGLRHHFEGFPPSAHPMAILSAMINSVSCYHPELLEIGGEDHLMEAAAKLLSKVRTIAAFTYKKCQGCPIVYPNPNLDYVSNFLHMMFSLPYKPCEPLPEVVSALRQFFVLHADHEQNCSTSTARMVGSSGANLFASVSAAVCALWGRFHGGANMRVVQMLQAVASGEDTVDSLVEKAKRHEVRLWGFGHRVYKNFDPRATILKKACDDTLHALGKTDALLDIARQLEERATHDEYFLERNLYPNVDFYSGILLRAIGIPLEMYTVLFAIGRMPGWIANWAESWRSNARISRPRQVYTGPTPRHFVPVNER